jgi:hypothetical protein
VKKSKKFLKQLKNFQKKIIKFTLQKWVLFSLAGVSLVLVLVVCVVLFNPNLVPNSDIYELGSEEAGLFANSNPSFDVTFGKKEDESTQWVRFESETEEINPFDPNYQTEDKSFWEKVVSIFQKEEKLGIEMSLSGVKLSETGNETIVDISDGKLKVEDILGTDDVETSTELLQVGRILGEEDNEQNISKETILNKDVWKGVDLEYQILEGIGVKEEIIIRSLESYMDTCSDGETDCEIPLNEFIFDLQLDKGVELHQSLVSIRDNPVGTYYFTDSQGNYLAHFLPCYAFDEGGSKTNNVDFTVEETDTKGLYKVHVVLDMEWMLDTDRIFPIHIDPSIVHDDSTDFSAGILNRLENATGPKIQLVEQELTADAHTVGLWHMNEASGGSVADSSGNSNTGTATGTTITTGKFSNARSFNGSSDYLSIPHSAILAPSELTVEAWIKPSVTLTSGSYFPIVRKDANDINSTGYGYNLIYYNGSLYAFTNVDADVSWDCKPAYTVNLYAGEYYHIAFTKGSGGVFLYINGQIVADATTSGCYAGLNYNSTTNDTYIGYTYGSTIGDQYANGLIDEVRISNIALTAEEVKADAQKRPYGTYTSDTLDLTEDVTSIDNIQWIESGVGTGDGEIPYSTTDLVAQWDFNETSGTTADNEGSCGASCDGTLTNMTTTGQDNGVGTGWTTINSKWGGAVMFDGSNDYVSVTDQVSLGITSQVTIESWFLVTKTVSGASIINRRTTGNIGGYNLELAGTNGVIFYLYISGSWQNAYSGDNAILPGSWYHVVGTYDGSTMKMYVNGVLMGSTTISGTINNPSSPYVWIGKNIVSNVFFNGMIDSTKIYSRALSSSEVLSNYNSTNIEFLTRTSADGNTWEEWKPITGETQLNALDNTYQYTNDDTDLLSYWPMDESTNDSCSGGQDACDVTSTRHGTATGTTIVDGKFGNSRYFNGSSDVVLVDDFFFADAGITIEAWVKRKSTGSIMGVVSKGGYGENGEYILQIDAGNTISFYEGNGSIFLTSITSTQTITDTEWHYIVATNDFTTARLYLDGVEIGTDATPKTYAASFNNTAKLSIGAETKPSDNSIGYYYSGNIDEVRLYDSAISSSTVLEHYNDGKSRLAQAVSVSSDSVIKDEGNNSQKVSTGSLSLDGNTAGLWHLDETGGSGAYIQDSTANGNDGTPSGTTLIDGVSGKARSFNGSSDYILIPASSALDVQNLTIEGWMYSDSFSRNMFVFEKTTNGSVNTQYSVFFTSAGTLYFRTYNSSGTADDLTITASSYLKTNQWNHFACTYNGSTKIIYINGQLANSKAYTQTLRTNPAGTSVIGAYGSGGGYFFNGKLDEIRVSNTARTNTEVYEEYRAGREHYLSESISSTDLSSSSKIQYSIASDRPGTYLESIIGESAYANNISDTNTRALLHLEEESGTGAYLIDSSSYGANGTPTSATLTDGYVGRARYFNGSSYSISLGTGLNVTNVTMSAWIKRDGTGESGDSGGIDSIVGKWTDGSATSSYTIDITESTDIASIRVYAGSYTACSGTSTFTDNKWHYIVGTYDGSYIKIYVDGKLENSCAKTGTLTQNSQTVYIGRSDTATYGQYFGGTIDEVRIDDTARTADEIRQAYEIGSRTHVVTIDFGAVLDSGNLITGSGDTSFTIDATEKGLSEMGAGIYEGERIIVRENYNGTEYTAQGIVSSVNADTGAVTVSSWDTGSTFPSSGYTISADVFKWQKEYIDLSNVKDSDIDAVDSITFRLLNGGEGRNIWIDNISSSTYLTDPSASSNVISTVNRYMQYMAVITTGDTDVTPYLSSVTVNYSEATGPTMDQIMRHGKWFNSSGQEQSFWWVD